MAEEGTEQKPAVKNVIITNSMVDALQGLVKTETLKEVYNVESEIVKKGIEDLAKNPPAAEKKEEGAAAKPAAVEGEDATKTAAAKKITDDAAAKKALEESVKAETEAYNKLGDDDKKKFDKQKEDYEKLSDDEKKKVQPPKLVVKEEKEEEEPGGVLGVKIKGKKETPATIEKFEDIIPFAKSSAGVELKDIKDLPKFFEAVKKFRTDSQNLEKVKEEGEAFKAIFENLPENFVGAIDAFYKGKDWKKIIGDVPKFDYNVAAEKQDKAELVKHYYPGKFKDEDFTATEKSDALKIAEEASVDKFINEQKALETERTKHTTTASKKLEAYKSSVKSSAQYLKKSFPDVLPDAEAEIVTALAGGPNEVAKMFFNKDGTCKEEAAEFLMFAKHGKSELMRMMNAASRKTETLVNEDILTRGADTPGAGVKKEGNQGGKGKISDAAKQVLGELDIFKTKKSF